MTILLVLLIVAVALVLLFFLSIMPRMSHKQERKKFPGVYYAHRGLHNNETNAPENSIAAFERAIKAGYGIELDVQLTSDRIPVVFHDFTLERVCHQEGKVCDYTYEQLKQFSLCNSNEKIPRFEEVLKKINGKVPLIVELKVEWMDVSVCQLADSLLRNYKGVYCVESFNPLALLWYRRYHNDVIRGQLSDGFVKSGQFKGFLYFLLQNLLLNWMTKPDFIAYNHEYETMPSRRLCKNLYKCMSAAWTIKSQEELDRNKNCFDLFIFDSFIPTSISEQVK